VSPAPVSRRPSIIASALAASLLTGLLLAELSLRWIVPIYGVVLGLHPRYLHTLLPRTKQLAIDGSRSGHPFYMIRINLDGHRGPDEEEGAPGPRIVVYGDSFIDAKYVPLEDTYPFRLERHLAALRGRPVRVINAGVAGYGPDQESLRLEDDLARRHADLVIVALFAGNDFGDLLRNRIFRTGPDGTARDREHRLGPEAVRPFVEAGPLHLQRAALALERKIQWARDRRAARAAHDRSGAEADLLVIRRLLLERHAEYESYVAGDQVIRNLLSDGYDLDVALHPADPDAALKRDLMAAVLRRIHDIAAASGTPLLFLIIPSPVDVSGGWPITVDRSAFPEYRESAATGILASLSARLGVPCVDLFEPFRAAGGTPLFRQQPDRHWNAAGMEMAAKLTADLVHSAALIQGGRKNVESSGEP
jgi:hypothetical protein